MKTSIVLFALSLVLTAPSLATPAWASGCEPLDVSVVLKGSRAKVKVIIEEDPRHPGDCSGSTKPYLVVLDDFPTDYSGGQDAKNYAEAVGYCTNIEPTVARGVIVSSLNAARRTYVYYGAYRSEREAVSVVEKLYDKCEVQSRIYRGIIEQ